MKVREGGQWIDLAQGGDGQQLFRGEWASVVTLAFYDFSEGSIPAPFVTLATGAAVEPTVATVASSGRSGDPLATNCARIRITNRRDGDVSALFLDMSEFPGASKVKYWNAFHTGSYPYYSRASTRLDGSQVFYNTSTFDWTAREHDVTPANEVQWRADGFNNSNFSGNVTLWVTGIEVLGSPDPYMLGEFVTHDNRMWKSLANNNAAEPGADGNWMPVLELPRPYGTTAQRPDPVEAGVGYEFFDTDLTKPIWSDGTDWVDATGTTA